MLKLHSSITATLDVRNSMDQLEQYQLEGAAFLAARNRASIFDEPGLGKTAQAIRALELVQVGRSRDEVFRTLIVCPAGVRQVWPYQAQLWGRTNAKVVKAATVFDLVAWQRGRIDVLVVSFEQATGWVDDITSDFFGCLIVDESHYLKNPEAKRTKALLRIAAMAEFAWNLTGTPMKNDPADLWVPLHMAGAIDLSFTAFQKRYFKQRVGTFSVSNTVRKETLDELREILAGMSVMRTFDDVGYQLPAIRLDTLPVDGEREDIVSYLRQFPGLDQRIVQSIEAGAGLSFDDSTHISTLRALIAEAKAPGYAKLVIEELKSGTTDKLVVMAHHRRAIEIVAEQMRAAGINVGVIVGGTSERDRERIVRSFQDDPAGVRVVIGNITAAGVGLTLHAAAKIDMLESAWTPTDNVQAIRRVRRRGQTRPTFGRFVMLANSFDQTVAGIVTRKANTFVSITTKDNLQEAMVQ